MRLKYVVAAVLLIAAVLFVSRRQGGAKLSPPIRETGRAQQARTPPEMPASRAEPQESIRSQTLQRLAYAQAWERPLPPAMAAFHAWTERYRGAVAATDRLALEAEGVGLARARRGEMLTLIESDPQRALTVTVPATVRQILPAAVLAELEARVAGKGDYTLLAANYPAGESGPSLRRIALINRVAYTVHPYGRREEQLTKEGASLHGIALDGQLALHESPLRVLEPGEIPAAAVAAQCPVSGDAVVAADAGAGVNFDTPNFAEVNGRIYEFCGGEMMLEKFEQTLTNAEAGADPRVQAFTSGPAAAVAAPAAPDAGTTHTLGVQKVLLIRVDFSDIPGDPLSTVNPQAFMDTSVSPLIEAMSYGKTSLATTVAAKVYRMPQTAASYAATDTSAANLHSDARTAASADYTLANFDRIHVVFTNLGTAVFSNSKITFAGEGSVNGLNVWTNGIASFNQMSVTHEFGHTYGNYHASLWRVTDGNPLSSAGTGIEYADPFDDMGTSSVTGVTRDSRHHYNPWFKNRLGWLPDAAVTDVTTSGTYRIYRFDDKAASLSQPLALRIFRDGVRTYWVGLRQNFATGTPAANGAYVIWGYNSNQQSALLDTTTPGISANDAALPIGSTLSDPAYGITIKTVARGGSDPAQWLDVEVTVPSSAPDVVTAWGREGVNFFGLSTGAGVTAPAPNETNVPADLTRVQAIAAGDFHVLALKADGTVVSWGDNTNGQATVPDGLNGNVAAVAAGGNISGVVKKDGTVQMWGESLGNATTPAFGLTGVKQLVIGGSHSVGIYHALALKTDGTIVGWGDNSRGQATPPAGLTGVVAIAASDRLSVALKSDGTVVRWGTTFSGAIAFPTGLSGVTAIASSGGAAHALALKTDGTVIAWGVNGNDQATVPAGLSNVVAIATGSFHSLALKADGSVVAWGSTVSGKTRVPANLPPSYAIAAGASSSFALTGQRVYIQSQPVAQTVREGGSATFAVSATGAAALTYQWRKDGVAIAGATSRVLSLTALATSAAGSYDVVISDGASSRTTLAAKLTVNAVPPPDAEVARIANLSIRTNAGTGAQTLIVGFVVGGGGTTGTKPLLIRGIGPTLGAFGVAGTLADPKLELYNNSTNAKIQENDNWGGDATITSVGAQFGAFALSPVTSKDAALYTSPALGSGSYSAQLSGVGGTTGVALAEIYDASLGGTNFNSTTPRLINVSARTNSGLDSDVLIAGFSISGPAGSTKKILIRGIGPTLAAFGVTGTLADPKLELYNSASLKMQENDNWSGTAELSDAFTSVGAFQLSPPTSKDAALVVTLPPGTYTVQVSGVGRTTGVALVELYELP